MANQPPPADADHVCSLDDRQAFMRLPLAERRERLAAQAKRLLEHYAQEPERAERELWQGGDIAEP